MSYVLCWGITQYMVVIPYWCYGTTCWSHLQRSRNLLVLPPYAV